MPSDVAVCERVYEPRAMDAPPNLLGSGPPSPRDEPSFPQLVNRSCWRSAPTRRATASPSGLRLHEFRSPLNGLGCKSFMGSARVASAQQRGKQNWADGDAYLPIAKAVRTSPRRVRQDRQVCRMESKGRLRKRSSHDLPVLADAALRYEWGAEPRQIKDNSHTVCQRIYLQ